MKKETLKQANRMQSDIDWVTHIKTKLAAPYNPFTKESEKYTGHNTVSVRGVTIDLSDGSSGITYRAGDIPCRHAPSRDKLRKILSNFITDIRDVYTEDADTLKQKLEKL